MSYTLPRVSSKKPVFSSDRKQILDGSKVAINLMFLSSFFLLRWQIVKVWDSDGNLRNLLQKPRFLKKINVSVKSHD